ncbi:MAG: undecaprenyl-diphosphate phosphatase [Woeseiaceae bacterium]|nr:undecaprenyl-diphosphate phosphatase [Woeseiaceae bacterium]
MTTLQIVVLAIVQGLTEFLPISSSGHLVLVPAFAGWADQGLMFDVAVHMGSLAAVCIYFRRDIAAMMRGGLLLARGRHDSLDARMALAIGIGTVPAAIAGLLFADWIEANLRDPRVVVVTLSVFGILMAVADRVGRRERNVTDVGPRHALLIGLAQAMALVPGTSRSGITITAGRLLGYTRHDAARFSFLLSAPVILLAGSYKMLTLVLEGADIAWTELATGIAVSGLVAYLSIEFFMRFISAIGLLPFALYRLGLAGLIVYVLL